MLTSYSVFSSLILNSMYIDESISVISLYIFMISFPFSWERSTYFEVLSNCVRMSRIDRLSPSISFLFFFFGWFVYRRNLFHVYRCVSDLLAAVLYVQHHGRYLHEADCRLSTRRHRIHSDLLARVHEQLRKSRDLHCVQSGISQSLS